MKRTPNNPRPSWPRLMTLIAMWLLGWPHVGASGESASGYTASQRLDVIFVLDNSGSMRQNDPHHATHVVVTNFAQALGRGSRIGVVVFDDDARLALPLTRALARDSDGRWAEVLSQVDYSGQRTNSPAGIERALYELKTNGRPDADKAIVLITDGLVDTGDRQRDADKKRWLRESLAVDAQRAGIRIYGIAFTEEADVELIHALAVATDAEYFRVLDADDIGDVLARIGRSIASVHEASAGDEPTRTITESLRQKLLPGVGSAPRDRTRGLVLLSLGILVGGLVLLYPLMERRRRVRRTRIAPIGPAQTPSRADSSVPPSRQSARPRANLVDVANVSSGGLLPISIERNRTKIGRDESNDIVIARDTISSFHATIDFEDGYYYVEDHRSTNGCRLNAEKLAPNLPMQLKSGDRIDFAEFEFRFIVPNHEPRGRTVVLDRTVQPGHDIHRGSHAPDADEADTDAKGKVVTSWGSAFDRCLAAHLQKIRAVGDAHSAFVDTHFTQELVAILSRRAAGLIQDSAADRRGHELDISRRRVHYKLCVLTGDIEAAADWYQCEHGGFANRLVSLLDEWAGPERECEAICVITFGMFEQAWISITILPTRSDGEAVEVMSFEFLSEDERRRALSSDIVTLGRAG